ncbi:HAD domain-containing protein [Promicromonospora sp. NPDC023987]|uniref:HAD domain-containing protein n=1 Tax=Promicromonospora sp. NPDC023987 TaxID=3155360 RepID=UPI00340EB005
MTVARSLLFLDVDGALLPFGGPGMLPQPRDGRPEDPDMPRPEFDFIDPALGPLLQGLGCDLMWATAWMGDANEVIAPRVGLPELPVADLPPYGEYGPNSLGWKTRALVRVAAGRPFVWVDDVIAELDRWFVDLEHPGPALLFQVESSVGLTADGVAEIATWLLEHEPGRGAGGGVHSPAKGHRSIGNSSIRRALAMLTATLVS